MGLTDALSGRIWHWNEIKDRGSRFLCSRIHGSPLQDPRLKFGRNYVYAGWLASITVLNDFLFDDAFQPCGKAYGYKIKIVDAQGLLSTTATLTCASIIRMFANAELEPDQAFNGSSNFLFCVRTAYGLHEKNDSLWLQVLKSKEEGKLEKVLLLELAEIWEIAKEPLPNQLVWIPVASKVRSGIAYMADQPNWDSVVDEEIKNGIR